MTVADTMFDITTRLFGIRADALTLAFRLFDEAEDYPLLGSPSTASVKIYLDHKDWVALAKARLGRPATPADQAAYETLQAATMAGEAVIAMSATTYLEVHRTGSARQRTDLANVIAELGGFVSIAGRPRVVAHQVRTALAKRFPGPRPDPLAVFGLGVQFAYGTSYETHHDTAAHGFDLPADDIRRIDAVGAVIGDYLLLREPSPDEPAALRVVGHVPQATRDIEAARLDREQQLAAMLADGTARRGRLGDIVAARHLYWELIPHLQDAIADYGVTLEEFLAMGKDWLKDFVDDVPSASISITLHEKSFRNRDKPWKGNDVRDGDAMSAAIPYCDVVLTDNYVTDQLATSPAVARQPAVVLANLADLTAALPGLVARRRTAR